ncbi:MAG: ATP-binding protein [Planctomycetia bacterium]
MVTLVATGWVSMRVVRLERERVEKARIAKVEENVSLALWRIDSMVAPMVALENARPFQGFGLPLEDWQAQQNENVKLDNRYFTLELASASNGRAVDKKEVLVLDGKIPKKLADVKATVDLIALLPEPTIRLTEYPTLQFGGELLDKESTLLTKNEANFSKDLSNSKPSGKKYSGKGKQARSKAEYEARQTAINKGFSSFNSANFKQNVYNPYSQQQLEPQAPAVVFNDSQANHSGYYPNATNMPAVSNPQPQVPTQTNPPRYGQAYSAPSTNESTSPANAPAQSANNRQRTNAEPSVSGRLESLQRPSEPLPGPQATTSPTSPVSNEPGFDLPVRSSGQQSQQSSTPYPYQGQSLPQSTVYPSIPQQPQSGPLRQDSSSQQGEQGQQGQQAGRYQQSVSGVYPNNTNGVFPRNPNNIGGVIQNPQQPQGWGSQQGVDMQQVQQIAPTLPLMEEGVWAPMRPVCLNDQLFLLRRVQLGGRTLLQGCLFDWPTLAKSLEKEVSDLLPEAHLVLDEKRNAPGRMLASLPVRLEPGPLPAADLTQLNAPFSPVFVSVTIAFGCVLLSLGAFAVLLMGMIRLGRRRSEFVTAVTHELRTPLTTFRMYSEMLSEGMVAQESQKGYLQTLESEADRLTHLVENVLSSARLERGRHTGRLETLPIGELITPIASRLSKRCHRAGMKLDVMIAEAVNGTTIRTNPSAVEQILWNLVDNACKYAVTADDRTIRVTCDVWEQEQILTVTVADTGPGIPRDVRRRLFCGFSKTASEAARTAPGVGLGLALSRRLARDLGGDLKLIPTDRGACFCLSLKLD